MSLRRGEGEHKGAQSAQRAMSASRRRVYAELLEDDYGNKVDARFLPHLSAKPGAFCPCPPVRASPPPRSQLLCPCDSLSAPH